MPKDVVILLFLIKKEGAPMVAFIIHVHFSSQVKEFTVKVVPELVFAMPGFDNEAGYVPQIVSYYRHVIIAYSIVFA